MAWPVTPIAFTDSTPQFQVSRGVRFDGSSSFLANKIRYEGDTRRFTQSMWIKRGVLDTPQWLAVYPSATYTAGLYLYADNRLAAWINYNDGFRPTPPYPQQWRGLLITQQQFRDTTSWYHLNLAVDTTQDLPQNRIKLAVNGSTVTAFITGYTGYKDSLLVYPPQNIPLNFNTPFVSYDTNAATLGLGPGFRYLGGWPGQYFNGSMSEVTYVDGQALEPTAFGRYDENGLWVPKKYSGSYGVNGYYLPFNNTTTRTTIGQDPRLLNTTDPEWPYTVFHLQTKTDITGGSNNTFIDISNSGANITRGGAGNVLQGAVTPYTYSPVEASSSGGSAYFDGNSELNAGSNSNFAFGTNSYSVEFWVYSVADMSTYGSAGPCFVFNDTTNGWGIWNNSSANQGIKVSQRAGADIAVTGVQLPSNRWNHIVVSRQATTLAIWLNGVRIFFGGDTTNWTVQGPLKIGGISTAGYYMRGYITGLRVTNGSAIYDPNSTQLAVPTRPPVNNVGNTVFLMQCNNAAIYDATGYFNLQTLNGATIDRVDKPYGNSSLLLDGNAAVPSLSTNIPNNFLVNFGTNDFTVEAYIYMRAAPTGSPPTNIAMIVGVHDSTDSNTWCMYVLPNRTIAFYGAGGTNVITATTIPLFTWVHVAAVRNGNTVTVYLNGVADASARITGSYGTSNLASLVIGRRAIIPTVVADYFTGSIADLRITRSARYLNNFTAPTSPLTNTGETYGWWPFNISLNNNRFAGSLPDVPANWGTNNGGILSSTMRGTYPTLSFLNKGTNCVLSNGGLEAASLASAAVWRSATATIAVSSGKWYWEGTVIASPSNNEIFFGVANTRFAATVDNQYPGNDAALNSWGYYINGNIYRGSAAYPYGINYIIGDTVGVAMDMDNGNFYVSKNGVWQGLQNTLNPTTSNPSIGRNPANQFPGGTVQPLVGPHYPAIGVYASGNLAVNFGQRPFLYADSPSLSAGFKPLCTANITPPVKKPGAFFEAVNYTGGTNTFNRETAPNLVLAMPLDSYNTYFDVSSEVTNAASQPKALYTTSGVTYTALSGALFNGTSSYIELSSHPDFDLGITGDWTIEWWQYWSSLAGFQTVWSNNYVTAPNLLIQTQNGNGFQRLFTNGGAPAVQEGNGPTLNTWNHYAIVKSLSTFTIFRNGSATGIAGFDNSSQVIPVVTNMGSSTVRPEIGRGNGTFFLNGYLRDFRIYKGFAKYTSTFNPLTATTNIVATTGLPASKSFNLGFQPDLVWIKSRNIGRTPTIVIDSTRGGNSTLSASLVSTATSDLNNNISFTQTGFSINSGASQHLNMPGATYVAYGWKRNILAGLDIVNFTKANATNESFNHSLGRTPSMMIVKGVDTGTGWNVYHVAANAAPGTVYGALESTAAFATLATMWNNTSPTANQFTLGTVWPAGQYMAYLFAEIPGVSRFGSYLPNGSADGPFVWCGFKPRLVLTKRVDAVSDWLLWDTARGPFNPVCPHIGLNANFQDQCIVSPTYSGYMDFTATGFKLRLATGPNDAGTYVFAAFADNPFGKLPGQVTAI